MTYGRVMHCKDRHLEVDAGCRAVYRNRLTGYHVMVYDGEEQHLDTAGGRWSTWCEAHSEVVTHATLALAKQWASTPEDWCSLCTGAGAELPESFDDQYVAPED